MTQVASTEEVHSSSSLVLTSSTLLSSSLVVSSEAQSELVDTDSSSVRRNSLTNKLSVAVEPSSSSSSSLESSSYPLSTRNNKYSVENSLNSNNNNLKHKKVNHKNHKKNNNNNHNNINKREKPDPETLVQIEKNLLSLFGFKKRPKIDRSKIVIPEAMKKLYAEIMGHELDSVNVPKPGLHTKSANTVRSFTHEGKSISISSFFFPSKLYSKF